MNRHQLLIGATVLAAAGTVGMAAWLTPGARDLQPVTPVRVEAAPSAEVVHETEAAVLPPPVLEIADAETHAAPVPSPVRVRRAATTRPVVTREPRPDAAALDTTAPTPDARPSSSATHAGTAPSSSVDAGATSRVPHRVPPPEREPFGDAIDEPEPLIVPAGAVLGVRVLHAVSSETAGLDDRVEGVITRDVIASGRIAVPAGTRVLGSVTEVTRGGKMRGAARLGVRFHTLVLAGGERVHLRVDPIVRESEGHGKASAAKIGGSAIGGAIIGGIMGGRKGAVLGGAAGAGAGATVVATSDRPEAELVEDAQVTVRLEEPIRLKIERR